MFKLSVAMIIKNEELTLDRILSQCSQFADEIIIVDTGSKDCSIDIAKKYTDKVYTFPWQDDFALARNFSFSKATMDFVMWLDADDTIDYNNIKQLQELKKTPNPADVYMLKYQIGDNFVFYRERILKRKNNYLWSGAVHEVITPSGDIKHLDITIKHDKLKAGNPKRNLNIYRKLLKNGIHLNPREQHYYARELYYNGYFKKCITEFKKHIKSCDPYPPNTLGSYIMMSDAYTHEKDYNNAIKYLIKSLKHFIPTAEVCCKLATAFEKLNKTNLAIFWYENALLCPKQTQGFVDKDYEGFIPCLELCRLYYHINKTISFKFYIQAKEYKPNHPSIKFNAQFFTDEALNK